MKAFERVSLAVVVLLAGTGAAQATTIALDRCNLEALCDQVTVTTTRVGNEIGVDVADTTGTPLSALFGDSGTIINAFRESASLTLFGTGLFVAARGIRRSRQTAAARS